jgi:hypothetical protein
VTDIADELAYHDQMHLIHDFEALTAGTSTETLCLLERFFREPIEPIQVAMGASIRKLAEHCRYGPKDLRLSGSVMLRLVRWRSDRVGH